MRIAFDHQIFMLQAYGGISRYIVRLAEQLIAMDEDVKVVAPFHCNRYLGSLPSMNIIGREIKKWPPKSIRFGAALNRYRSTQIMGHFAPKILHETYYTGRPIASSGAARILTVHDMIHEHFPDMFLKRDKTSINKRKSVERADHVICISHSTKRDLCEMFDVAPEKVTVVHHGYEKLPEIGSKVEKVNIDRPFLLFVGHRGGYKNFKGMLLAVASRKELRKDFDIIAFGGPAFNASEIDLIHKAGLRDGSVHQISGGDAILGQLYREASAFVYPSLYEGFGLPLLEAMAHGCPVVSSNTSSMPEVVGQAGEYFSPIDIGEQADAICNVVFDLSRREGLVHLGNEQLNNFSWRKCAEETLDLYKNF